MFINSSETNIPYDGIVPEVKVVYMIDGVLTFAGVFTGFTFKNGNIKIDHGGPNSGFVLVK